MATAYICPMCVFNCDNLPDLEQHLEGKYRIDGWGKRSSCFVFLAHENNSIQSPIKRQPPTKSVRNSPLYAKSQAVLNLVRLFSKRVRVYFFIFSNKNKIFLRRRIRLRHWILLLLFVHHRTKHTIDDIHVNHVHFPRIVSKLILIIDKWHMENNWSSLNVHFVIMRVNILAKWKSI